MRIGLSAGNNKNVITITNVAETCCGDDANKNHGQHSETYYNPLHFIATVTIFTHCIPVCLYLIPNKWSTHRTVRRTIDYVEVPHTVDINTS